MIQKNKNLITLLLFFFYLAVRFFFTTQLDLFGEFTSYYFEVLIVFIVIGLHWRKFISSFLLHRSLILLSLLFGALGFVTIKGAKSFGIFLPFDFSSNLTLFFLLLVAPVLEELLFRFFMWRALERWGGVFALIVTSLLFSYSHLHAIWLVPESFFGFIYYQSAYTLILGGVCGWAVFKYGSLLGAILVHFFFNFGFYLGS